MEGRKEEKQYHRCVTTNMVVDTVEPPFSEPSVIQTLFQILKSQKMVKFSAKPSNK